MMFVAHNPEVPNTNDMASQCFGVYSLPSAPSTNFGLHHDVCPEASTGKLQHIALTARGACSAQWDFHEAGRSEGLTARVRMDGVCYSRCVPYFPSEK